jgi:2,4-dienoyl-CoA reductase-like NADH-dependent reductase (Old Yellow Enzyme family)
LGGFGLIITEATAVSPEGRITNGDLGLWNVEQEEMQRKVISFCQKQGAKMGIQLAHAGRKASHQLPQEGSRQIPPTEKNGWQTVSSSEVPFLDDEIAPVSLDYKGLNKVKNDFIEATKRACDIGYDVLEIHAAHGYLFHQFYSPLCNERTDEYGGSFENRIRFLIETIELVRKEWKKALFVRISASDWIEGGWTIDDSVRLAKKLKEIGVDLVDTSSGGNVPKAPIYSFAGYQVDFSAQIKEKATIKTGAVGKITTALLSEDILQSNKADLIFYGREALRQPNLPLLESMSLGDDFDWPIPYERAKLK